MTTARGMRPQILRPLTTLDVPEIGQKLRKRENDLAEVAREVAAAQSLFFVSRKRGYPV